MQDWAPITSSQKGAVLVLEALSRGRVWLCSEQTRTRKTPRAQHLQAAIKYLHQNLDTRRGVSGIFL